MSDALLGRLNHVGVVVRDLAASQAAWGRLFALSGEIDVKSAAGVDYVELELGGVVVELIQPRESSTVYASFLRERGEGVHHLCFEVADVEGLRREREARGLPEIAVRDLPDGRRVVDLEPGSFGGVSLQLCQLPAGGTQ